MSAREEQAGSPRDERTPGPREQQAASTPAGSRRRRAVRPVRAVAAMLDMAAGRGSAAPAAAGPVPPAAVPATPPPGGPADGPVRPAVRRTGRARALRVCARLVAGFVLAGSTLLALPGTASALPGFGGCTTPPTPESPGQGISGFFLSAPKNPLPDEDPFAPGTKTTPFEQYGLAGLSWYAYDLGCGGAARDPSGAFSSWAARLLFIPAKAGVAALAAVSQAALEPSYLDAFDPLMQNLTSALNKAIFTPLFPLAVMLTGLLLMAQATRQRVSASTTAIGWCVLVTIMAAALFAWPVRAGHAADSVIRSGVGAVSSGITGEEGGPGTQVASLLYEPFLYRMWLMGEFCDPDSQGAREHGSDLLQAQALNWRQAETARANGDELTDDKQDRFNEVAGRVKKDDPAAYECVSGHGSANVEAAILADVGVVLMAPFLLVGGLILIAAYLIVRFAVIFAPALLTAGAFFPLRGIVIAAGRVVAAALLNGILFTLAVLLVIRVDAAILAPTTPLPAWLRLLLVGVVTVVMWYLTRPFRKLTTMVTSGRMAMAMGDRSWYERPAGLLPWRRGAEPSVIDDRDTTRIVVGNPALREESRGPAGLLFRGRGERTGPAAPATAGGRRGGGSAAASGGYADLPPAASGAAGGAESRRGQFGAGGPAAPAPERRAAARAGSAANGAAAGGGGGGGGGGSPGANGARPPRGGAGPAVHQPPSVAGARRTSRPVAGGARRADEGLYDAAASYRPAPEDDNRGYLRPIEPELDDASLYRLFDPDRDRGSARTTWSG